MFILVLLARNDFRCLGQGWRCLSHGRGRDVWWVSKARLVITAVVVEGRSQSQVARASRSPAPPDWRNQPSIRSNGPKPPTSASPPNLPNKHWQAG
jgi:hypothetical protein